ncbi:MAG: DUF4150 domain-containing protein [Thermodesulfobacteriota bacterium]
MNALTIEGGQLMATPDTCQTPQPLGTVPVPYPNIAMPPVASSTTTKVLIAGMPALTKNSRISISSGDEAGVAGGVACGQIMGEAKFTSGSFRVKLEGSAAVFFGSLTTQNANNAVGCVLMTGQFTVSIMS